MNTMKIRIKPLEEIMKTLDSNNMMPGSGACFAAYEMSKFCGKIIEAIPHHPNKWGHAVKANDWSWRPEWFEYAEPGMEEEDYFIVDELNQMLEFIKEQA